MARAFGKRLLFIRVGMPTHRHHEPEPLLLLLLLLFLLLLLLLLLLLPLLPLLTPSDASVNAISVHILARVGYAANSFVIGVAVCFNLRTTCEAGCRSGGIAA